MVHNQGWTPLVFLIVMIGSLTILSVYRSDRERPIIPMTAFYATDSSESTVLTNSASNDAQTDTFSLSSSKFVNGGDMPKTVHLY
jgi:hypothetical protein